MTLPRPDLAAFFQLRRDITFLNHGSYGACPEPVFAVYQEWQRQIERQPVDFFSRQIKPALAFARTILGGYLGSPADDIVFVPNITYAMNAVAHALKLEPGDEVLTTDHEYGAVDRSWTYYCEKAGAHYVRQTIPLPLADDAAIVAALWRGVTPRTKVISVSHITSPTALILPVAAICARARAEGILTVVDGAHAPGQIDLDLTEVGADFYGGNCHKWLCAPKGAGFLYARPEAQPLLDPLIITWGWRGVSPGPSQFLNYFEWGGTDDPSAFLSVPAAIEFQREHDWPAVRAACHALAAATRAQIAALTGEPQICDERHFGQMCYIPLPAHVTPEALSRLWREYQIEIPAITWGGRPALRLSIQAYNTPGDCERLLEVVQQLVRPA